MTIEEAYFVLGVTSNDSEEKIKKKYKALSRKYHPDANVQKRKEEREDAEEKFKEVQNAYGTIKKAKTNSVNQNVSNNDITQLKEEKIKKMNSFFGKQDEKFLKDLYKEEAEEKIAQLKDLLVKYRIKILNSTIEENIKNIYHAWEIHVGNYLQQIKVDYYNQNHILEEEEEPFTYGITLNKFIEKLKKQKDKKDSITREIDKETEKYEYYAGYDKMVGEIENIKKTYKIKIKENKATKGRLIAQMHQEITKKLHDYYEDKKKWKELASLSCDDLTVEELNDLATLQNLLGTDIFRIKYKELIFIKNKVQYKKNENAIQKLYLSLWIKAQEEIKKLSFSKELYKVSIINKIMEFICKIIEKAKNGLIKYDGLVALQEISFQNFFKDMEILSSFHSDINAKDIYVLKEEKDEEEADQIRWLQVENDGYYMYSFRPGYIPETEKIKYENMEQINKYYIPLHTFLELAQPIFYSTNIGTTLYGYPKDKEQNYYCYIEDTDEIIISIQIFPFQNVEVIKDFNKKYAKYKDKNTIEKVIVNQINAYQNHALRQELEDILVRKR